MDYFFSIIALLVFLAFVHGAIYLFYKAIRFFKAKKFWSGFGALLVSLALGFLAFFVIAAVIDARERALRCSCHSHQANIVLFLKMYAADHQESYPSTFNGLVGTNLMKAGDSSILVCPASHTCANDRIMRIKG